MTATTQASALHSLRSFPMRPFSFLLLSLLLSLSTTAIHAQESWRTALRAKRTAIHEARESAHDGLEAKRAAIHDDLEAKRAAIHEARESAREGLAAKKAAIHEARVCAHDAGLWGTAKSIIIEPVLQHSLLYKMKTKHDNLGGMGRFAVAVGVGFGASKIAVKTAVKTVKKVGIPVGAAYLTFEALEFAGVFKHAHTGRKEKILHQSRDYVLRTVDGVRHDIRHQMVLRMKHHVTTGIKEDPTETLGFGSGALLVFAV